jgi:calcineurin-like phosphoesterase family protein
VSNIFVVSDTHFGHANILKFTDSTTGQRIRPQFSSVEEMDEHMVQCWNSVVNDGDIVYHLGDVYYDNGHRVLPQLKGRKRLIHINCSVEVQDYTPKLIEELVPK